MALVNFAHRLFSRLPLHSGLSTLHKYFIQEAARVRSDGPVMIVAIQGVEIPLYFALFGQIALHLRRRRNISGRIILVRSLTVGNSLKAIVERSLAVSYWLSSRWARLNKEVVGPVGYRSQSFGYPFADLCDSVRAYQLWRRLRMSKDTSTLKLSGIEVGDLVIDSYLRFRPSPAFDVSDRFVWRILWQALRDIRRAHHFFSANSPCIYLSSYSCYVQHGIAARVALKLDVPVYVFGGPNVFCKKLSSDDWFHVPRPGESEYRSIFEGLDHQEERLRDAEKELCRRLSGDIDDAISYMKKSAYSSSGEAVPNLRQSVVVFLHDFCDSPHIFPDLVFTDFWEWIVCTMRILDTAGIAFVLKPHPNQSCESAEAVEALLERFPGVTVVQPGSSNKDLVDAGMLCGVTVYGTIAHELAYLGVPTIACAKHPHHSFGFCRTAHSVHEYESFLKTPGEMPLGKREMRRQALAFYYMHNLFGGSELQALRRQLAAIWRMSETMEDDGRKLLNELIRLESLPAYDSLVIAPLLEEIREKASCSRG